MFFRFQEEESGERRAESGERRAAVGSRRRRAESGERLWLPVAGGGERRAEKRDVLGVVV